VQLNLSTMDRLLSPIILKFKPDGPTRYLDLHQRENTMTASTKNSVLDRGVRCRGARAVAGSRLHELYAATLAEPLPADLRDLVAQLVALEAGTKKSSVRPVGVWQLAPPPVGHRS
jgi:hypothetical protein